MSTPDAAPIDPSDKADKKPMTQEEFDAWLRADPRRHEALLEVLREKFEEKRGEMSAEQVAELEQLNAQLRDELAGFMVPEQYNALADRIRELNAQESFTLDDVDELRAAGVTLRKFMDSALDLKEPRRSRVIAVMQDTEKKVNIMLDELKAMGLE